MSGEEEEGRAGRGAKVSILRTPLLRLQKELGKQTDCPYMCAYKLVTVKFKWWGLQNKVENFIQKVSERSSPKANRT